MHIQESNRNREGEKEREGETQGQKQRERDKGEGEKERERQRERIILKYVHDDLTVLIFKIMKTKYELDIIYFTKIK